MTKEAICRVLLFPPAPALMSLARVELHFFTAITGAR